MKGMDKKSVDDKGQQEVWWKKLELITEGRLYEDGLIIEYEEVNIEGRRRTLFSVQDDAVFWNVRTVSSQIMFERGRNMLTTWHLLPFKWKSSDKVKHELKEEETGWFKIPAGRRATGWTDPLLQVEWFYVHQQFGRLMWALPFFLVDW